jgi:hypothetical protein
LTRKCPALGAPGQRVDQTHHSKRELFGAFLELWWIHFVNQQSAISIQQSAISN